MSAPRYLNPVYFNHSPRHIPIFLALRAIDRSIAYILFAVDASGSKDLDAYHYF